MNSGTLIGLSAALIALPLLAPAEAGADPVPITVNFAGSVEQIDADFVSPFLQIGVQVGSPMQGSFTYDASVVLDNLPADSTRGSYSNPILAWEVHVGVWSISEDA